jgi:CubicO group peptidase (beta-lactamase class C family)
MSHVNFILSSFRSSSYFCQEQLNQPGMIKYFAALLLTTLLFQTCLSTQPIDMKAYNGDWEATIPPLVFSHKLTFTRQARDKWQVTMTNDHPFYDRLLTSTGKQGLVELKLGEDLSFKGKLKEGETVLSGFLESMDTQFRLDLQDTGGGKYVGQWNSFYVAALKPAKLYLSVENGQGDDFEAYPVLPDNRYRGTYSTNFHKKGNEISFLDKRAGYQFKGTLQEDKILLDLYIGGVKATATPLLFTRSTEDWEQGTTATSSVDNPLHPTAKKDGWATKPLASASQNTAPLELLIDSVEAGAIINLNSILVAHRGALVYENYFNGYHADLPHDQRSAAKSIGSAMIGIALEDGVLKDVNDNLYDYMGEEYQATKDAQKAKITLAHLLTMSSGLDVVWEEGKVGQATEDNYQQSPNWLKTVLTAPMIYDPGARCHYGSANPFLLGVALSNALDTPLDDYINDRLFGPLGISNYTIPLDPKNRPYFGGGTYLTSRDMLKFGELYRNGGVWNGQRILSQSWVEESLAQHTVLENARDNNAYGYLFWHHTYEVGGRKFEALEARGAGGQFITIVPELELVLVITSGNYRNDRHRQPEQIIAQYLLPVFEK